ncbi:hypothetical protein JCM16303_000427 [Sporobolomyces ruberrimus]
MSSRTRPSRAATKKVHYIEEEQDDGMSSDLGEAVDDGDDAYGTKKQTKRAKKQRTGDGAAEEDDDSGKQGGRSVQRKQTKSKKASEIEPKKPCFFDLLPFELVSEILSYTTPKDLLEFARTNKHYRSILMSKTRSARIWRLSRKTIGLPDLTAEDFSEPAYAALVFGTHCDHCSRYAPSWAEPWLRLRLCKSCRTESLIKIDAKLEKNLHYHPATLHCVTKTPVSPAKGYWRYTRTRYTLKSEVEFCRKKLATLQEEDEFDESLEFPAQLEPSTSQGRHRRRGRRGARPDGKPKKSSISYKEPDEEELERIVIRTGGRVAAFVEERRGQLEKIYADGKSIADSLRSVHQAMQKDRSRVDQANQDRSWPMQSSLGNRLSQINGCYASDLFLLTTKSLESILKAVETLTNEAWITIKPKLLAAIDKAKEQARRRKDKEKVARQIAARQSSCRLHYRTMKASFHDSTFFPLFKDFLHLPSVQALWQLEDDDDTYDTVDEGSWSLLHPLIKAEVEEYQLDFATFAVRLILSTHREFKKDEDLESAIQNTLEGDLDEFFALASSLVVCGGGCRGQVEYQSVPHGWNGRTYLKRHTNGGFVGSVVEIAAHLLEKHNGSSVAAKHQRKPSFPIVLPLQVASSISAIIEVGQYSSTTATVPDLDRLDAGHYKYENSPTSRRYFLKWRDLVSPCSSSSQLQSACAEQLRQQLAYVSLAAKKADSARPPIHLPAPAIVYYPSNDPSPPSEEEGSDSEEDD